MLKEYELDLAAELAYAKKWAYERDPAFFAFDEIGGDCTNFVSQCIYAGGAVMNYTPDVGWYYISLFDRAAAWTGVEFFFRFMTTNDDVGPFGEEVPLRYVKVGDVIQLGAGETFYHSLFVTGLVGGMPYVTAHTNDVYNAPLSSYYYEYARCIHIIGARKYL